MWLLNKFAQLTHARFGPEALAAVLAVVSYLNILPNDYCDDGVPVVQLNRLVTAPGQWGAVWTKDYWWARKADWPDRDLLYRPLAISSYRIIRSAFGGSPLPQHVLNIMLHALAATLVVRISRRFALPSDAAAIAGALFAVLPIHTEVLGNIVGRADLLAACGLLGAMLTGRRAALAVGRVEAIRWGLLTSLLLFAAMTAKESAAAAVAVVVVLEFYWRTARTGASEPIEGVARIGERHGTKRAPAHRSPSRSTALVLRWGILVAVTGIYLSLRYYALEGALHQKPPQTRTPNFLVDAPLWQRSLGGIQLWGLYWLKTVWPATLCIHYSINTLQIATSPLNGQVIVGVLCFFVPAIASVAAWRRGNRSVAFLFAALLLAYAPTSNTFVLIRVSFAERIWYLPSIFAVVLFAMAYAAMPRRPIVPLVMSLVLLGMVGRCWIRSFEWRNNGALYTSAIRDHPDDVGCLNLYGQWLFSQARYEAAAEAFRKAVTIDLGFTDAHRNLGVALMRAGRYAESLPHLQIANMHVPDTEVTLEALTFVREALARSGRTELDQFRAEADANPHDAAAEIALLRKLHELGFDDEALQRLRATDDRFSADVAWQREYAAALVYANKLDDAVARYQRCVDLDDRHHRTMVELAMLLLERRKEGDVDRAGELAARAAALAAGDPAVMVCQAELAAYRGEVALAIQYYQRAIQALDAASPERAIYGQRLRVLGG